MIETFERDLEYGEQIENNLLKIVQEKYPKAYKMKGYFKEYDIYVPEINKSIEVKSDRKSNYTGNIVVEIEFNSYPSALATSKADYWVWWDGVSFTWFELESIKKCIRETKPKLRSFTAKGDTKEKKAYLIKKHILFSYSI